MKTTLPDNLYFISAQPVDAYFLWQVEVQIVNFRKFGISDRMTVLVWYPERRAGELDAWRTLAVKYPEVHFGFYPDGGVDLRLYVPQLRPHILKQYFRTRAEDLKDKVFFYHDSDILFTRLPDFKALCEGPVCWQSDCSTYLDYTYLRNKEVQGGLPEGEALQQLADIGGISVEVIKSYDKKTGGAQCLLKGIDAAFWEDVERMSLEIRNAFAYHRPGSFNQTYFASENEGFQSWCADMWALNFALWKREIPTGVTGALAFSWATDSEERFFELPIFHNAGASAQNTDLFYKGAWMHRSPLGMDFPMPKKGTASYHYALAIKAVG